MRRITWDGFGLKQATQWGLSFSRVTSDGAVRARGCDLSFRLCLLPHLNKQAVSALYRRYASRFWGDHGVISGFAEYAGGGGLADIDSGPMILGIGMSATGMGLGAAVAAGDEARLRRLCQGLVNMQRIRPMIAQTRIGGLKDGRPLLHWVIDGGCDVVLCLHMVRMASSMIFAKVPHASFCLRRISGRLLAVSERRIV